MANPEVQTSDTVDEAIRGRRYMASLLLGFVAEQLPADATVDTVTFRVGCSNVSEQPAANGGHPRQCCGVSVIIRPRTGGPGALLQYFEVVALVSPGDERLLSELHDKSWMQGAVSAS